MDKITRENYLFWRAEAEILRKPGLPMSIYDEERVKIFSALLDFLEEDIESLKKHAINLRLDADECALENERLRNENAALEEDLIQEKGTWEELEALLAARRKEK